MYISRLRQWSAAVLFGSVAVASGFVVQADNVPHAGAATTPTTAGAFAQLWISPPAEHAPPMIPGNIGAVPVPIRFDQTLIPAGSPISYDISTRYATGPFKTSVSGYYQISFALSVHDQVPGPADPADRSTGFSINSQEGASPWVPVSPCAATAVFLRITNERGQFAHTSMTCIAILDTHHQYQLMKMDGVDEMRVESPGEGTRYTPPASLSINLLEPTS
jgi:hypothetical protein